MNGKYISESFIQEGIVQNLLTPLIILLGFIYNSVISEPFVEKNFYFLNSFSKRITSLNLTLLSGAVAYTIINYFNKRIKYDLISCGFDLDCKIDKLEKKLKMLEISEEICNKSKDPNECINALHKEYRQAEKLLKEYKQDRFRKNKPF